jgi:hypothetical protein
MSQKNLQNLRSTLKNQTFLVLALFSTNFLLLNQGTPSKLRVKMTLTSFKSLITLGVEDLISVI